jgi:hypothetical protein
MAMGVTGVHSRGTAIRHATGKPYRLVVMDNDIHERKEIEDTLIRLPKPLVVSVTIFYQALMRSLSSILGLADNLVCYCVGDPRRARARWPIIERPFFENFEYDWRAPPVELSSTAGK